MLATVALYPRSEEIRKYVNEQKHRIGINFPLSNKLTAEICVQNFLPPRPFPSKKKENAVYWDPSFTLCCIVQSAVNECGSSDILLV